MFYSFVSCLCTSWVPDTVNLYPQPPWIVPSYSFFNENLAPFWECASTAAPLSCWVCFLFHSPRSNWPKREVGDLVPHCHTPTILPPSSITPQRQLRNSHHQARPSYHSVQCPMGPQVTSPQSLAIWAHAFLSLSLPLPHHNSWWFHCLGGWLNPGPRSRSSLRSSPTILSSTLTQPKTVILLISANHPFPAPHATTTTPLAPQCPQPFHPTWSSIHGPLHLFTTSSSCYHAHTCFFIQHSTNSTAYHWIYTLYSAAFSYFTTVTW